MSDNLTGLARAILAPYAPKAGGFTGLATLSENNLAMLITHPGPRSVISQRDFVLKLPNVGYGYKVHDSRMQFKYAVTFDPNQAERYATYGLGVVIPEFPFGYDNMDHVWLATQNPGDYFYIVYDQTHPATAVVTKVVLMVLMSPADDPKVGEPAVSPSPSAR